MENSITTRTQTIDRLEKRCQELEAQNHALQEVVRLDKEMMEVIPSSLLMIDRRLRVVSANRNFLEKARRTESHTVGRRVSEVFAPAVLTYTNLEEKVKEVFDSDKPFSGGQMTGLPGLHGRIYFYRLTPLRNETGIGQHVMLLMEDVTEQERLGEEVRRAERHLASVVESANDVVVSMDASGCITTWNRAGEDISGYQSSEVKGQHLVTLCVEEDRETMGDMLNRLVQHGGIEKEETSLATKGGQELPVAWACSPMRDDEGGLVGIVGVGRDLTERRQLQAQVIQSAKMASLGVMAGGIAHEIRNPLAISSAAAQLLLDEPENEQLHAECAQRIYSGIQRASYIIENLLKFARPPEQRLVAVDVNEALEGTLVLVANQITLQRIELEKAFTSRRPWVWGNKSLLQQVFSNLILNACKAMPDGGQLTISTRFADDEQVEILFADSGGGIPADDQALIFDPFFTTMPVGQGTGLGLTISYGIIQQFRGMVEVESEVGQGSTFTVTLPLMDEGQDHPTEEEDG